MAILHILPAPVLQGFWLAELGLTEKPACSAKAVFSCIYSRSTETLWIGCGYTATAGLEHVGAAGKAHGICHEMGDVPKTQSA